MSYSTYKNLVRRSNGSALSGGPAEAVDTSLTNLADNAAGTLFNVKWAGAKGDGTTDDTAAIQTAINTVYAAGGGVIFFPAGIYIAGGALQTSAPSGSDNVATSTPATYNAQIRLPHRSVSSPDVSIALCGPTAFGPPLQFTGAAATTSGAIIKSTITGSGTKPSIIGGPRNDGVSYPNFSSLNVRIESLCVRAGNNPTLSGVDLEWIGKCELFGLAVDNGVNTYASTQPSNTAAVGVLLPNSSNNALVHLRNVFVQGFYCGVRSYEHTVWDNVTVQSCYHGVELGGAYHANTGQRLMILQCPYSIVAIGGGQNSGSHFLSLLQLDIEADTNSGPGWMNRIQTVSDASNLVFGNASVHVVKAGVGVDYTAFTRTGGTNFRVYRIDTGANLFPSGLPVTFIHGNSTIVAGASLSGDLNGGQTGGQWYQNPGALNDAFKTATFTTTFTQNVQLSIFATTGPSNGIATWTIRNSSTNAIVATFNTIDFYSASTTYNVTKTSNQLSLPAGSYYLRGDMLSKNASSSGYYLGFTSMTVSSV